MTATVEYENAWRVTPGILRGNTVTQLVRGFRPTCCDHLTVWRGHFYEEHQNLAALDAQIDVDIHNRAEHP